MYHLNTFDIQIYRQARKQCEEEREQHCVTMWKTDKYLHRTKRTRVAEDANSMQRNH